MVRDPALRQENLEQELEEAARIRRERDLGLTMSERLERLNELCKQASQMLESSTSRA